MSEVHKNILIAYYSRSGNNYVGGSIVNLSVGNTEVIIPFCTHEGSGLSRSVKDIEKQNPDSEVIPALAIRGGSVKSPSSRKSVEMWLKDNNIL